MITRLKKYDAAEMSPNFECNIITMFFPARIALCCNAYRWSKVKEVRCPESSSVSKHSMFKFQSQTCSRGKTGDPPMLG